MITKYKLYRKGIFYLLAYGIVGNGITKRSYQSGRRVLLHRREARSYGCRVFGFYLYDYYIYAFCYFGIILPSVLYKYKRNKQLWRISCLHSLIVPIPTQLGKCLKIIYWLCIAMVHGSWSLIWLLIRVLSWL